MALVENISEKHLRLRAHDARQSGAVAGAICCLQPADADDVFHPAVEHLGVGTNLRFFRTCVVEPWNSLRIHGDVRRAYLCLDPLTT